MKDVKIPGLQSVVPLTGTGNIAVHIKKEGTKQDGIILYSLPSMKQLARIPIQNGHSLEASSDGKLLGLKTGVDPGSIVQIPDLGVLWKGIGFVGFIPGSRLMVISGKFPSFSIVDPSTGKTLASVPQGECHVTPNGRLAVCVPYPQGSAPAELFDLQSGHRISRTTQSISTVAFSPDGKILAAWESAGIRLYDPWATLDAWKKKGKQVPLEILDL